MNITKIINSVFNLFGFTVVNTNYYDHINWEVSHYKKAYEDLEKSTTEYHNFVTNEVMSALTKSDERCANLFKLMN